MEYLNINPLKHAQDLYAENHKTDEKLYRITR